MSRGVALLLLVLIALTAWPPAAGADGVADFAFQPHPGAQLPLAAALVDEHAERVTLGHYFTNKPVILVLDYLRCKTLCGVTLKTLIAGLDKLPLEAGRDFQMLAISIDPRDRPVDSAAAKAKYLAFYHRTRAGEAGIQFLTGPAATVKGIAETVGFPYRYDPALDQYIHPAGFIVASASGRISRYLLGVGATPAELTGAIADAEENKALGPLQWVLLLCHIEGATGRYTAPILTAFTIANLGATVALIAIFAAIRRNRHR